MKNFQKLLQVAEESATSQIIDLCAAMAASETLDNILEGVDRLETLAMYIKQIETEMGAL